MVAPAPKHHSCRGRACPALQLDAAAVACVMSNGRNGHARSLRQAGQFVGNRHACSVCCGMALYGIQFQTSHPPPFVGQSSSVRYDKRAERACPFPTTSRAVCREQACLFRLLRYGVVWDTVSNIASPHSLDKAVACVMTNGRNGHARSLRQAGQFVGNRHACSVCCGMVLHGIQIQFQTSHPPHPPLEG